MLRNLPADRQSDVAVYAHVGDNGAVFDRESFIDVAEIVWPGLTLKPMAPDQTFAACAAEDRSPAADFGADRDSAAMTRARISGG
jgi:hypothetical protein